MPTLRQNCLRRMAGGDQVNGLIIATIGLLAIGISLALSPTSVLCKMGCHRWDFPGGKCEDCGVRDSKGRGW